MSDKNSFHSVTTSVNSIIQRIDLLDVISLTLHDKHQMEKIK